MARLLRLSLAGFRNLRDAVLEIPSEGVALLGRNAQGKSNLLEAIYYLETLRSFRNARDENLVRFGEDHFRIAAELGSDDANSDGISPMAPPNLTVAAAYSSTTKEKRVSVDGSVIPRLGEAIGKVGAVLFAPDDLRLVSGPPAERRRYLDILLSLNRPGYLEALQRFRQALHRRNATLRRGASAAEVSAWDGALLRSGAMVTTARADWVRDHSPAFGAHTMTISGTETMTIRYDASIPGAEQNDAPVGPERSEGNPAPMARGTQGPMDIEAVTETYDRALVSTREQERRLRTTLIGPHRDDLELLFESPEGMRELREFGSGGQRRTAALTLRLLEAATIREHRNREPILLLDDIFAELDEDRSRRILSLLDGISAGQVLLTAPKESDIRFREATLPRWSIQDGEIRTG